MNKLTLTGRLVRDVNFISGNNKTDVAKFTLAVRRPRKREGQADADFVNVTAFGKKAEFCAKYLTKGTKVECVGSLHTGSYTAKDGRKVYTTEMIIDEIEFGGSMRGNSEPVTYEEAEE